MQLGRPGSAISGHLGGFFAKNFFRSLSRQPMLALRLDVAGALVSAGPINSCLL